MFDRKSSLIVALGVVCVAQVCAQQQPQASPQTPTPAAPSASEASPAAKPLLPVAREAESEPPRRLKFKSRRSSCLCDDAITEADIEAAAAGAGDTKTPNQQPPRSKK